MKDTQTQKGIYVDLDSLLDLRMSTIISNDEDLGKTIMENGSYENRICDEFGYMGLDVFKIIKDYTNKNSIIENAFITNIFEFLMIHISNLKNNRALTNNGMLLLTVNTFPYNLSNKTTNKLLTIFNTLLPMKNFYIDSIYENPNDITIGRANSDYFSLFMYDGMDWLKNNILKDKKGTAPELKLFIPALLDTSLKMKTNEDYEKLFKDLENASKMTISVNFLEIKKYNLNI